MIYGCVNDPTMRKPMGSGFEPLRLFCSIIFLSLAVYLSAMPRNISIDIPILLLGESHANAIARAVDADALTDIVAIDVRNKEAGIKVDDSSFVHYRPDHLILAFGGTEHNVLGLIESEPKFDFVYPPYLDFADGRALIPSTAIEALLKERIAPAVERAMFARSCFASIGSTVHALAPPPPFLSMDQRVKLPKLFKPLLEAGITPANIRRKLYAVACKVIGESYASHGIKIIPAPTEALDDQGHLHRHLWDRDPTHGNDDYGRLVIGQLRKYIHG